MAKLPRRAITLPYRGLGSGIKRALEAWPEITFTDDRDDSLFTATVHRKIEKTSEKEDLPSVGLGKTREKTREKILLLIAESPEITTAQLTDAIGITPKGIEWQMTQLKKDGLLKRIGPAKGGRWEVR